MPRSHTPVIIGVALDTPRQPGLEPLAGWQAACQSAAADAGISTTALAGMDFLAVAHSMSWRYDDPVARLADRLGAAPGQRYYTEIGGGSGHYMMTRAVEAIQSGKSQLSVLCGGESLATLRNYRKQGATPPWQHPADPTLPPEFEMEAFMHPDEVHVGLAEGYGAAYSFAMRDIARRAHLGIAPDAYRQQLGELLSGMTHIAADNPNAWFRSSRDPDFLTTLRPDNRMLCYPYTKHMMAFLDCDKYAALIMTTQEHADRLGILPEKRIYPHAFGYASDHNITAENRYLWKSEAMGIAAKAALNGAGLSVEQLSYIDLYSCFTSAVNFGRDALGISHLPGDKITLTGGLPYGGGPGSSYVLTSMVEMVRTLRRDPGAFGLVSAVGMMLAQHGFSIYSSQPPRYAPKIATRDSQTAPGVSPPVPVVSGYGGLATVAAYTLMYDRSGRRTHGAAICDLPDGSRAYCRIVDPNLLAEAECEELVGRSMRMVVDHNISELRYI